MSPTHSDASLSARPRANRSKRPEAVASAAAVVASQAPEAAAPRRASRAQKVKALARVLREVMSVASLLGVLALAALAAREGHRWMVTTERFSARDVTVTGLTRTREADVLRAARISAERNVLSVDCEQAARAIEGLPWVARARVSRHLPATIQIAVEERSAVATVSANGVYLVASDGTLFKRAMPGDPADLPVITGIDRADFDRDPVGAREAVRDVLALLSDVEASAVGAALRIDEVHREVTGDLSIVVEGMHVWLGRGPYRAKLTRLRVVMRELRRRGLRGTEVHLESDRNPERVTVRLEARAGI